MRARPTADTLAGSLAALGALAVALVQLRDGVVPILDTVTYWSGAREVGHLHVFSTRLAPSFSNFDVIHFLDRGGRLPFVDFPIGYPLVAGVLGAVIGASTSMAALTVIALLALAVLVVRGGTIDRSPLRAATLVVTAVGITALPAMRLATQGALSEPLFVAGVVGLVLALARYRTGGRWWPVATLVVLVSLLRFIGGPLALVAGWERHRRTRSRAGSIGWTAALLVPALANIVLASTSGGGHDAGWRGLERLDVELFVRSTGGWLASDQGDLTRSYFVDRSPAWWSWPIAVIWIAMLVYACVGYVRRRTRLQAQVELALVVAAVVTAGLVLGFLGFDALVVPDNRLMLPAGVLTLCAIAWSVPSSRRASLVSLVLVALWFVVATAPADIDRRFTDPARTDTYGEMIAGLDPAAIVSNDADGFHRATGVPAAYLPTSVKPLTGERVDTAPLYAELPCALSRADALVVVVNDAAFSNVDASALDTSVRDGRLEVIERPGATLYSPTTAACD